MIKIINDRIDNTLAYLEAFYGRKESVYFHILEESDCIQAPNGEIGFGVFCTENQHIYIAADVPEPETTIPQTIAHEYMHFMQWCEGRPYDEEEADRFAEEVLALLKEWRIEEWGLKED